DWTSDAGRCRLRRPRRGARRPRRARARSPWLRPAVSRFGPHRRGIGRQRHGERVQQERDQRVVPAQRHQLHHPGVAEESVRGIVGLLVQTARVTELAGHRVDGPFVVRLEQRILAAPDRVHHRAGDAVLARHRRVRPPLELRLPPRADRDDGDLRQPPLDRRAEPERGAERGQPPPGAVTNALNGPARPPSAVTTRSPRPLTMLSHSCWPSGPSSSRRTYRIRVITRTITTTSNGLWFLVPEPRALYQTPGRRLCAVDEGGQSWRGT